MEGHGKVGTLVGDAVKAKLVCHVCDLVLIVRLLRDDLHGAAGFTLGGKLIARLSEVALENLHEAVSIAVVVDWATFSRRPDEHELFDNRLAFFCALLTLWLRGCSTHQVAFAVSFVDKVARVSAAAITKSIFGPVSISAIIQLHETSEEIHVDVRRRQTRRGAKSLLEQHNEVVKKVLLLEHEGQIDGPQIEGHSGGHNVESHDGLILVYVWFGYVMLALTGQEKKTKVKRH